MKKNRMIWNYLDMFINLIIIFVFISIIYIVAENLEKYIYRYTIFPFVAFVAIFALGMILGRGIERTMNNKPIGYFSKKMANERKKKNIFIFSNDGTTYTPHKEIIEDIKSGEIVHVKQFAENEFNIEEFDDIYTIHIDDIVDDEMKEKEEHNK